jgi:hypothetical protein
MSASPRVFVSRPAELTAAQEELQRRWLTTLSELRFEPFVLRREAYEPVPWGQLRRAMEEMDGALVLGFRQLRVDRGEYRPDTPEARAADGWLATAWNQIEAGIALALGLPLLVIAEEGVEEGIFERETWRDGVYGDVEAWANRVREVAAD